jgi:hypothetical protein
MAALHFIDECCNVVMSADGQRYVPRICAAPRADGGCDVRFVFLPCGYGLPLATDWEPAQGTLSVVKCWAGEMTAADTQGGLRRARACWPEALLGRGAGATATPQE